MKKNSIVTTVIIAFGVPIFIFIVIMLFAIETSQNNNTPEISTLLSEEEQKLVIQKQQPHLINDLPFIKIEKFLNKNGISFQSPSNFERTNILQYNNVDKLSNNNYRTTLIYTSATPPNNVLFIRFDYTIHDNDQSLSKENIEHKILEYFDMLLDLPLKNGSPETTKKWLREKLPSLTDQKNEILAIGDIKYELSLKSFEMKNNFKATQGKSYFLKVSKQL